MLITPERTTVDIYTEDEGRKLLRNVLNHLHDHEETALKIFTAARTSNLLGFCLQSVAASESSSVFGTPAVMSQGSVVNLMSVYKPCNKKDKYEETLKMTRL